MVRSSFTPESTDEVLGSIYYELEVVKDANQTSGFTEINHGLGRTPTFMVMIEVDGNLYMSSYIDISSSGTVEEITIARVNSTTVRCVIVTIASSPLYSQALTRTFRVFALIDKSQ